MTQEFKPGDMLEARDDAVICAAFENPKKAITAGRHYEAGIIDGRHDVWIVCDDGQTRCLPLNYFLPARPFVNGAEIEAIETCYDGGIVNGLAYKVTGSRWNRELSAWTVVLAEKPGGAFRADAFKPRMATLSQIIFPMTDRPVTAAEYATGTVYIREGDEVTVKGVVSRNVPDGADRVFFKVAADEAGNTFEIVAPIATLVSHAPRPLEVDDFVWNRRAFEFWRSPPGLLKAIVDIGGTTYAVVQFHAQATYGVGPLADYVRAEPPAQPPAAPAAA